MSFPIPDATSSGEAVNLQHRLRSLSTGLVGLRNVLHDQQLSPEIAAAAVAAEQHFAASSSSTADHHFAAAGYGPSQLTSGQFDSGRGAMASAVHYQNQPHQPPPVHNIQPGYAQGSY